MLRRTNEEPRKRKRPGRRTIREIVPRGKALILGRRAMRRHSPQDKPAPVVPLTAVGIGQVLMSDGETYPAARASVPASDWTDSVSEVVAELLFEAIGEVAAQRGLCARDPERDFTRDRKITLEMPVTTLVLWDQHTIDGELRDAFSRDGTAPRSSAFCQQWAKLSDEAMPLLLRTFARKFAVLAYLGRFRLLAADGTGIRVPCTGDERTRVRSNQGSASHDELHPTCCYDVLRHTFEDVVFQGARKSNEPAALCELVDRLWPGIAEDGTRLTNLWVADRNYCTLDVICHMLESGSAFVVRAKDDWVEGLLGYPVSGPSLDATVTRYVTRSESRAGRSHPADDSLYHVIKSDRPFDALPPRSRDEYPMTLRVVRVPIRPGEDGDRDACADERWMNLVTNLPAGELPAEVIEQTYRMRWTEEIAYLHLKHVVGARVQHTRDYARLCQEVVGRLVQFNACSLGTSGVAIPKPGPKHERATDVNTAFETMVELLRGRDGEVDVEAVASRSTHAVQSDRANPRKRRLVRPTCFKYRC